MFLLFFSHFNQSNQFNPINLQLMLYALAGFGLALTVAFMTFAFAASGTIVMEATRFSSCFTYSARSSAKSANHSCSMLVPCNT